MKLARAVGKWREATAEAMRQRYPSLVPFWGGLCFVLFLMCWERTNRYLMSGAFTRLLQRQLSMAFEKWQWVGAIPFLFFSSSSVSMLLLLPATAAALLRARGAIYHYHHYYYYYYYFIS